MKLSDKCPSFLVPRLRLFLSADIIGSTAQKQSKLGAVEGGRSPNEPSWFTTIQGFYFEAQQSFRKHWNELSHPDLTADHLGEEPKLWKTVGDEVLFTKLVTDHRQILTTIKCWILVLADMRSFLDREGKGRLGVKSTAWLAGFPIRNKEVVLQGERFSGTEPIEDYFTTNGLILNKYYQGEKAEAINVDFIGPSIDTGFRLTGQATARKLIVSVEVAYILALTARISTQHISPLDMRFDGEMPLKGVLGGGGYPIFWIDLSANDSAAAHADTLMGVVTIDRDTISKYCAAFFNENSEFIFPPFIIAKSEGMIDTVPPWYEEQHNNLIKWFDPEEKAVDIGGSEENLEDKQSLSDPKFVSDLAQLVEVMRSIGVVGLPDPPGNDP